VTNEATVVEGIARDLVARVPRLSGCRVVVVLGSGLGAFAGGLEDAVEVPYDDIEGIPSPGVAGHEGRLVVGRVGDHDVAVLQGRVHLYEGYPPAVIVRAVRSLIRAGVGRVVLTNAAGGINPDYTVGDLVLVKDHINRTGANPMTGPEEPALGPRFSDMTDLYVAALRERIRSVCAAEGLPLREGVYAALLGPTYETPAEIRMLRTVGADLVGMSTVPEALAAHAMGAQVVALSFVSNVAAGLAEGGLAHSEVTEAATAAEERLTRTLRVVARTLSEPEA
jgi:purine-nucleoside phosphorylase